MSNVLINPFVFGVAAGGNGPDGTQNYVAVTIQSSQVPSAVTDFPVFVDLSDLPAAFFTSVQADGGDIRVTESNGTTRAPVDLQSIDTGASTGELHFKASSVSASSNTTYRIYYNSSTTLSQPAATDTYGRNAVWTDYAAVLHLNTDPTSTLLDSTGNNNDGTSRGSMTSGDVVTGLLGDALDLDGTDDAIELPSIDAANITVQAIINLDTLSGGGASSVQRIASKYSGGGSTNGEWLLDTYTGSSGSTQDGLRFGPVIDGGFRLATAGAGTLTTGAWIHVAGVYDGSESIAYKNGAQVATAAHAGTIPTLTQGVTIGEDQPEGTSTEYFNGQLDEFRLRASALSSDWLSAEHTNQSDPTTFYSVGSEQAA